MSSARPVLRSKPVPIGRAEFGLSKLGAARFDLGDPYHIAVSLSWPAFAVAMLACWLTLNLIFALLYWLSPGDVANTASGAFTDLFFFSIETLATVGYGVMAPASLYGHIVSAAEIVAGMAFTAIVTGLLFVRFSRPKAKIVYADNAVVTMHDGRPTLMLRMVNGRVTMMSNATVRLFVLLGALTAEGTYFRRIHELHLEQSHLPVFIMPWTIMHVFDEESPLRAYDAETLANADARLFLTIEARDHALYALVTDTKDYSVQHIRFGMHFADMIKIGEAGGAIADLSRISLLDPDAAVVTEP